MNCDAESPKLSLFMCLVRRHGVWVSKPGEHHRSSRATCRVSVDEYRRVATVLQECLLSACQAPTFASSRPTQKYAVPSDQRLSFGRFQPWNSNDSRASLRNTTKQRGNVNATFHVTRNVDDVRFGRDMDVMANRESPSKFARAIAFALQGRAFE